MNKENIKIGMKVCYKDDEWEFLNFFIDINGDECFFMERKGKGFVIKKAFYLYELKDLKEIEECQTSTTIPSYNFDEEELVEECSKLSLKKLQFFGRIILSLLLIIFIWKRVDFTVALFAFLIMLRFEIEDSKFNDK